MKKGTLKTRCCGTCGQYYPSIAGKATKSAHSAPVSFQPQKTKKMTKMTDQEQAAIRNLYIVISIRKLYLSKPTKRRRIRI